MSIASQTNARYGWVKGQPVRFRPGHSNRKSAAEYVQEDRGYATPCWVWQRAIGRTGYGNTYADGTTRNAHRVYYERHRGSVPDGMQLDHLCRVRACVNPDHLQPVTNRENSHRGSKRRLSWDDIQAIRASTESNTKLAPRFGVSASYIGQIRLGRRRVIA